MSINTALSTANITTLSFSGVTGVTLNAQLYPNLLSYIGYYLESDTLKVHSIINAELAKAGEWSSIKSPNRAVTVPPNPTDDHYLTMNGYFINNSDLSPSQLADKTFKTDVETATKLLSTTIQNKAKASGFLNLSSESVNYTVVESPSGTQTINASVVLVMVKP